VRCRKAHWYLSARCDGTLSERQRLRLEAHLESCEECRREAFYFSEIGSLASRLGNHGARPDFNLRLRAAIRRSEEAAARPVSWQTKLAGLLLRPALVAASVVVLGLGGLGAWSVMHGTETKQAISVSDEPAVSPEYGLTVPYGTAKSPSGELIPVSDLDTEARRLQERYFETVQWPRDYVLGGVRLDDSNAQKSTTLYVLPTVSTDQVAKNVSY
jgi:hypothetical protein